MNYIYYFKNHILLFPFLILGAAIGYTTACYFKWQEPIILDLDNMIEFLSFSFTYIFICPLIPMIINSQNKNNISKNN